MNDLSPAFLARSKAAFLNENAMSLADVKRLVEADPALGAVQRRDLVSALNRLPGLFGPGLETIEATPRRIRDLFASRCAAEVGLSEKTFANIRSLIGQAMGRYAAPVQPVTKRLPIDVAWRALLERIGVAHQRQGLYRLATYCSVMGIAPEDVTSTTLTGLRAALEAEEVVKKSKTIIKTTITSWNRSVREVPGWPQQLLSSPTKPKVLALPLVALPVSFQADVAAWQARMADPDPFDEEAPARALRTATINHRVFQFRLFASAVVESGYKRLEEITSIAALLELQAFKAALRVFLERIGRTPNVHNLARTMRLVAKHHCHFEEATLSALEGICRKLDPGNRRQMTERNRRRLLQFDDPRNVGRLLRFPADEAGRAERMMNPLRAAKAMERAIAVSLLIHCGLRITSLRTLQIGDFTFTSTGLCTLIVPGKRTKTGRPMDFELNAEVTALLRRHIGEYRPRLPGAQGGYLFPSPTGGARSKNALSLGICAALRRHTGLEMNLHLFRHAVAKIAVEADPGAYLAVSRVLGHSTINTTMGHYLGTETKAAGRYLDRLLIRAEQSAPKSRGRR